MQYAYSRATVRPFDETTEAVEVVAGLHGFVVSRVYDMHATLASKGFEIAPLRIYVLADAADLNDPGLAALAADLDCKVYVHAEPKGALVTALRPTVVCLEQTEGVREREDDAERRVADLVDAVADGR